MKWNKKKYEYGFCNHTVKQFRRHDFQTKMEFLSNEGQTPKVIIEMKAYLDMFYLVEAAGGDEVGWLGTISKDGETYLIEEIFIFDQEVSSISTEIDPESVAEVATDLIKKGEVKKVNSLKFWGHVHPGNSTTPSSQDEEQMSVFKDGNDYFLRGIFDRNGRAEFTLFDYVRGLRFNDVPWDIKLYEDDGRKEEIKKLVSEKVKKVSVYYTPASIGSQKFYSFSYYNNP